MASAVGPRPNCVSVLVVDATPMGAQLLSAVIARDYKFNVTRSVASMDDALAAIEREDHQVGLISTSLENDQLLGLQLIRRMRQLRPEVRSIALIDCPKRELTIEAFRAGARGIISRTDAASQLSKAISAVHKGDIWATAEQLTHLLECLADSPTARLTDVKGNVLLSKREAEIVSCVSEGLTNREIAARLGLRENTVKNYLFHTFNKLGVSNRLELILYNRSSSPGTSPPLEMGTSGKGNHTSIDWLKAMAERGFGTAHLHLAKLYSEGSTGVIKDRVIAYSHLLLAEQFCNNLAHQIAELKTGLGDTFTDADLGEAQRRASQRSKDFDSGVVELQPHGVPKLA
ncbi:MAG TPA: LuxR C-terminal-related transcriptional regulator [Dongiaceae bacterium]|nr:LuxR C-terminal-related transcriptional regulator [Dongiaceae bacterium]